MGVECQRKIFSDQKGHSVTRLTFSNFTVVALLQNKKNLFVLYIKIKTVKMANDVLRRYFELGARQMLKVMTS